MVINLYLNIYHATKPFQTTPNQFNSTILVKNSNQNDPKLGSCVLNLHVFLIIISGVERFEDSEFL